jgi:hypothetical protein
VNWVGIVFNNLYYRLKDLFALVKVGVSQDNIKFGAAQVVDIFLQYWFLLDLTFILLKYGGEDESVA